MVAIEIVSDEKSSRLLYTPIREHPEGVIAHMPLDEHVEQMRRVRKMHVIVARAMSKEVVHLLEGLDLGYGRVDVAARVQLRCVHVALGVDCVCETSKLLKYEPTGLRIEDLP